MSNKERYRIIGTIVILMEATAQLVVNNDLWDNVTGIKPFKVGEKVHTDRLVVNTLDTSFGSFDTHDIQAVMRDKSEITEEETKKYNDLRIEQLHGRRMDTFESNIYLLSIGVAWDQLFKEGVCIRKKDLPSELLD